ncbi:hypothetical protein TNCT_383711 [Trichonephila clavata]|uniref:SUN domain-containing protein n=1 Tax=Trichonephila clavata TaxID=2740835 RepID=A0A8X6KKU7_TRICU|nr:hypothetical protein TNCT_383711 [Trichonephila clavata]
MKMKKPCCIENVNISPSTSSCSMILRSACSHGRSHHSVINSSVQKQENIQRKRKSVNGISEKLLEVDNSKNSTLESSFESSESNYLEQHSLKSTKTFSVLKESLYSQLHFSGSQKCDLTQQYKENLDCVKKLNFSEISSPVSSLYVNGNFENKDFSDNAYSIERDHNFNTTVMSRTRRLERGSLRALSESETEEDVSINQNRVKSRRSRTSGANSHLNSSEKISSSQSHSDVYNSFNHINSSKSSSTNSKVTAASNPYISTPTGTYFGFSSLNQSSFNSSPELDVSTVQYSTLDKLRWLLWRYIYLKIITIVNFDVWLLSRLRGRYKTVILLLLPLLFYLLYSALSAERTKTYTSSFDVLSSSLATVASSIYSLLSHPLRKSGELLEEADSESCPKAGAFLSAFWGIPSFFSNFFIQEKSTSFSSKTTSDSFDTKTTSPENLLVREEFESRTLKALDARFNELAEQIQVSHSEYVKAETANVLQKEISDLHVQFKSLSGIIKQLEKEMQKMEKSVSSKDVENMSKEHTVIFDSLNTKLETLEEKLGSLNALKSCCDQKWSPSDFIASIEKYLVTAFRNVIAGEKNTDSPYLFFHHWLNSKFIDSSKLSAEINTAFMKMKKQQESSDVKFDQSSMNVVKSVVENYVESLKTNLTTLHVTSGSYDDSLTQEDMRKIVKEALLLYDADKTGKVDFALESGGGSVLSTRCSESYIEKTGKILVLGLPLWSNENSPRTAIQPDIQPGKCWAFKGSQGYLVIQLSYTIYPTGFTLEHIPVSLSPTGSIDSAPKEFSVWGLASENDFDGTLLGTYTYEMNGEPLQYFPVQNVATDPFYLVELKVHSNHGNLEYTCLYRFRVHGTRI